MFENDRRNGRFRLVLIFFFLKTIVYENELVLIGLLFSSGHITDEALLFAQLDI